MLRKFVAARARHFRLHTSCAHAAQRVRLGHLSGLRARIGIHQILDRNRDLSAEATVGRIKLDEHKLHQNLRVDHDAGALGRADARLVLRKPLAQLLVGRVLVAQAAHEAAAAARDLQGVERRLLDLRRLHRNRLEHLEEVLAAAVLAAALVVGHEPRLVARADLAHLDAAAVFPRERLRNLAEVDALVGQVVDEKQRLVERQLEVDDLRGESQRRRDLAHAAEFTARLVGARGGAVQVFDRRDAQDLAVRLERILAAARVLDVVQHLRARDALAAA